MQIDVHFIYIENIYNSMSLQLYLFTLIVLTLDMPKVIWYLNVPRSCTISISWLCNLRTQQHWLKVRSMTRYFVSRADYRVALHNTYTKSEFFLTFSFALVSETV